MNNSLVISTLAKKPLAASRAAQEALIFLGANALIVLSAQVSITLPFSPVPITGQTFGVLLSAMALGRTRAIAVVSAYLIQGAMGLPVFAGGAAGFHHFAGPTGGYLVGFLLAAAVVGALADRGWDRGFVTCALAMLAGQALIFACGLTWLSQFVQASQLLTAGLWPFIPGAIVKTLAAFALLPLTAKWLEKSEKSAD